MEPKYYIITFLMNMACYIFGIWIGRRSTIKKRDGIFRVNTTDPNKDVFSLELEIPIGVIPERKYVIFHIVNEGSQEKPVA